MPALLRAHSRRVQLASSSASEARDSVVTHRARCSMFFTYELLNSFFISNEKKVKFI